MNRSKIGRILLSVVIAFILWWYVISTVSPDFTDTVYNIPVVLEGETVLNERGLMVTGISADKVSLKLNGNRSDLVNINSGNTTVKVDLSKISDVGGQIAVNYTPQFPSGVSTRTMIVQEGKPEQIFVSVSRRTSREIPVEVKWIGSAKEGFITDRENRVLDYPSISIQGPQEAVDTIEKAVIEVDLTNQTRSISEDYRYTLCDAENNPVNSENIVTNTEQIRLEVKIRKVQDIALTYALVEGGGARAENVQVTLSMETLRVAGSEAALEAMGDAFSVCTINLAEITKATSLTFPITLPEGVINLTGAAEVTADIKLTGLSTKELSLQTVTPVNVPEGMKADVITESLSVVLRGPVEQISKVSAENVTVSVDLTGAELGTSTYKATVKCGEGFELIGVFRSEPISVSLTES